MQIDIEQIKKILPHRYPFLMIDRIVEMGEKSVTALKNVTVNEPFFNGHFTQRAVMPGVLMIEAMAQTVGFLILSKPEHHGKLAYLTAVDNARFRRAVVPGDQLTITMEVLKIKSRLMASKGTVKVGDELACEANVMFTFVD